jgi:tetratricopeptide (TPR) repeat protein
MACRVSNATAQSCTDWLRDLEVLSGSGEPAVHRNIGATYLALADLTRNRETKQRYREGAFRTYENVVKANPSDVLALLGLANASASRQERIKYLRQVVAVQPKQIVGLQSLASELTEVGGPEELLEAAELLKRAYFAQTGLNKWHLAASAKLRLVEAGNEEGVEALQKRVRSDIGADRLLSELASPTISETSASDYLGLLCYRPVVSVLGATDCLSAIETAIERVTATSQTDRAKSQTLAESIVSAMETVAMAQDELSQADPAWRAGFASGVERLVAAGYGTSNIHRAFANFAKDPAQRLRSLERAAALAPHDGGVAVRLGEAYLEQGRETEAAREFRRAKSLLPESQHQALDYYLKRTEEAVKQP